MKSGCKNVSSLPTGLFCKFFGRTLLSCLPLPANTAPLLSQFVFPHVFCSCLEICSTNNLCNFWDCNLQQVGTHTFCGSDDIFTQTWNCGSPNKLWKGPESSATLLTNTSIEWSLYLSWSNHRETSFSLEVIVGSFSQQDEWYLQIQWAFFATRFSQVNVNTMKKIFDQRSEL